MCKSAVQYSCSKEIPDNHGSPRTHTRVISRADNNPTEDPVHLQDPQHPFQHHKPHVFLPLTALNMDTSPCHTPTQLGAYSLSTAGPAPSRAKHSSVLLLCFPTPFSHTSALPNFTLRLLMCKPGHLPSAHASPRWRPHCSATPDSTLPPTKPSGAEQAG